MITKWLYISRSLIMEEQWKINGILIDVETENEERIYDFSPIAFQAGDILGVFIPLEAVCTRVCIATHARSRRC